MPAGVEVVVEDGFAVIDFVDPATRGPGLASLLKVGGPGTVEVVTRVGPRRLYVVPEGNAREAGLIDAPKKAPAKKPTPKPAPEPEPEPAAVADDE